MTKENQKNNKRKTKVSYISIPNEILFDEKLTPKSKYLYLILKSHSMNDFVNMKLSKLKESLGWTNNRVLKRELEALKKYNYVHYTFEKFPHHKPLEINLYFDKPFVQIDRELFNKVKDMKIEKALVLIYILEYYYNHNWGYAKPSIADIQKYIKMNNGDLRKLFIELHNNYLCEFCQGERIGNGELERRNNRYIPNVSGFNSLEGKIKKRYYRHKQKDYFFFDTDNC